MKAAEWKMGVRIFPTVLCWERKPGVVNLDPHNANILRTISNTEQNWGCGIPSFTVKLWKCTYWTVLHIVKCSFYWLYYCLFAFAQPSNITWFWGLSKMLRKVSVNNSLFQSCRKSSHNKLSVPHSHRVLGSISISHHPWHTATKCGLTNCGTRSGLDHK